MISKPQALSLIIRTTFYLSFASFLGIHTYDQSDLLFTTTYLLFTALILYFPPFYEFFIPDPPTHILKKIQQIDSKTIPTILSFSIMILTYIILKHI
jgi:hypothetical protein